MGIEQYTVVLVNLDPTIGTEINKTRPCLVISPSEMNRHLRTLVVAPMTTSDKAYPTRVKLHFKGKMGFAAIDQIRTIDKKRVVKKLGSISPDEIVECKSILHETFVA